MKTGEATSATHSDRSGAVTRERTMARQASRYATDILCAIGVGAVAACAAVAGFYLLDFHHLSSVYDTWFDADIQRIVGGYYNRGMGWHVRTNVHPLYAMLVAAPCIVLRKIGLSAWAVSAVLVAFSAFAFAATFYCAARVLRLKRLDAILATFLMLSTGASIFWLSVPETYSLGAMTMLLAMVWLGAPCGSHDWVTYPLQSAITLSITVTNWMAGLLAGLLALGFRRAIVGGFIALVTVAALSGVQKLIFPNAGTFLDLGYERRFVLQNEREPVGERLVSFVGQPLLAPQPKLEQLHPNTVGIVMSSFVPAASHWTTRIGVLGWGILLPLGVLTAVGGGAPTKLVLFVGGVLLGQVVLHMLYGGPLFLYTLHFAPFVVLIAALACASRWRKAALVLIAVTALASFAHNIVQFRAAAALLPMTTLDQRFVEDYIR